MKGRVGKGLGQKRAGSGESRCRILCWRWPWSRAVDM